MIRSRIVFALLCFGSACAGIAQDVALPKGRVSLDVVVTDAAGKPVAGLQEQDFTLLQDNQPLKVLSFQAHDGAVARPEPPVKAIVVVDALNNGFTELGLVRQGLEQFLRQNGGHTALPISLLLFTSEGMKTLSPPTSDGNALAGLVEKMNPSIRPQGIYPFSLSVLALEKLARDEKEDPGRKLLVWLGSGWETPLADQTVMTRMTERNRKEYFDSVVFLSAALREARIALYGGFAASAFYDRDYLKGVRKFRDVDPRNLSLSVLALETGGRGDLPYVNRDSDVSSQLNSFVADASTFYTLSFDPPAIDHADEYHDLKVVLTKPGLTARTSSGYYNQTALSSASDKHAPVSGLEQELRRTLIFPDRGQPKGEFVGRPLSVADLEQELKQEGGKHDGSAAKDLYRLRLTERLSSAKLASMKALLPGVKAKAALTELADASAFLSLPATEIPAAPKPDIPEQRRILSLGMDYLKKTIPRLPNFYATRTTVRFEDTSESSANSGVSIVSSDPMREAGQTAATVIYRDHQEVVDAVAGKRRRSYDKGLETRGTFGPILSTAMFDAAHGITTFSHWEQGAGGLEAVFKIQVPREQSHYDVAYAQAWTGNAKQNAEVATAYHGEITFDPATGTILRLALQSDTEMNSPMLRADVMVEYGEVEIGGKQYTCPVKSVAVSQGRAAMFGDSGGFGNTFTRINDVVFSDYHMFRTEMRMITDDSAGAAANP